MLSASTDMGAQNRSHMKGFSLLFQRCLPFPRGKQQTHRFDEEPADIRGRPGQSNSSVGAGHQLVPKIIVHSQQQGESISGRPIDTELGRVQKSSMNLGYRVRGVARSNQYLSTGDAYARAAPGALNSPSGTLRH